MGTYRKPLNFLKLLFVFLALNFGALAIGSKLMNNGSTTEWYLQLNKAPWTPPGWVFGFAWSLIMFCFSIYMTKLTLLLKHRFVYIAYGIQLFLNVIWNYLFFAKHLKITSLIVLLLLTITIGVLFCRYLKYLKYNSLLIAPYFVWLLIASSLNFYILLMN